MMLTPLNIQVAIIKAFYALAKKSVKYYTGLAFGKNNTCLFKEIRLLRAYVEILKNFKIVGSTISCCCSVEGDYDLILNTDLPLTVANIQFGCDNQGYMVFNNVGYSFTYWYDNNNDRIVIQFISDLPNPNRITNNPNFAIDLDGWSWNKFNWSGYAGIGSAQYTGGISGGFLFQGNIFEIGKTYTVTFDILTEYFDGTNDNTIKVIAGTQEVIVFEGEISNSEITTISTIVTCFGSTNFEITAISNVAFDTSANLYITNVDVREVLNTTITIEDVEFSSECNILGDAPSPIEVAVIETVNHQLAVTVDNIYGSWDGNITIASGINVLYTSNPIPAAIMNDPIAIVEWWATPGNGLADWVLLYDEDHFVLYSPFNNVNYSAYTAYFNQYQGGTDATLGFDLSGLTPFVNVNTPAYADILFEQNTFVLSRRPETPSVPVPATLPYSTTATPAIVDILIPINQFSVGQPATMSIPLYNLFTSLEQEFYYQGSSMFSNATPLSTIQEVITLFNANNGLGFSASNGGTQPINETLATALNADTIFNTAAPGDRYIAKLSYTILGITTNVTIGEYIVGGDDVPADVASYVAFDIIDSGVFQGTVSVNGTVITLTAPLGTGASWNTIYKFTLQKGVSGRAAIYPFSGGVGTPTTPIYILNIQAPNVYSEASYNGGVIEIVYPLDPYEPDGGQFAGGINSSPGIVTFDDSLTASTIYTSSTVFTSIEEMIEDFNTITGNTLGATAEIMGSDFTNYTVRITVPSPPEAAFDFNGTTLVYMYNLFSIYTYGGIYYNGSDITTSTYTLTVYDLFGDPDVVVTNTGNFTDIQAILDEINADPTFNADFTVFTGEANDIYLSTILAAATFNGYSFDLDLTYASAEYVSDNFTTPIETMVGGVDRVAPSITLVNDFNATTIYSLTQDTYNFNGINGFINAFNTASPFNYSALSLGTFATLPEIRSVSLTNIPNQTEEPIVVFRLYYQSISPPASPVLIGTYTPATTPGFTGANIAANLAASANALWVGSTNSSSANNLTLQAPLGTNGSFNGRYTLVEKTIYTRAVGNITVISGSNGVITGKLQLGISGSIPVTFPVFSANGVNTASWWASAYVGVINGGTGTHGYTAALGGPTANRIIITAPSTSGTSANGKQILTLQTADGVATQATIPVLSGGSQLPTIISTSIFAGGGLTIYDKVRFTANPAVYTWEYNGSDLIYTNLSASPDYIYPGEFFDGNDNTAGQVSLLLTNPPPIYPNPIYTLYNDVAPVNYTSFQGWANAINNSVNNLDFSASVLTTDFTIHSPEDSFSYFNDSNLALSYIYASPQWSGFDYDQELPIENGVDPELTPYEGSFTAGDLGDFINTDPCSPSTVTQTCLTNSQISKVIQHIDKLVK